MGAESDGRVPLRSRVVQIAAAVRVAGRGVGVEGVDPLEGVRAPREDGGLGGELGVGGEESGEEGGAHAAALATAGGVVVAERRDRGGGGAMGGGGILRLNGWRERERERNLKEAVGEREVRVEGRRAGGCRHRPRPHLPTVTERRDGAAARKKPTKRGEKRRTPSPVEKSSQRKRVLEGGEELYARRRFMMRGVGKVG